MLSLERLEHHQEHRRDQDQYREFVEPAVENMPTAVAVMSWVKEAFLEDKADRERPDVIKIHKYLSEEAVLAVVEKETGRRDVLQSTGTTRQIVMASLYKYGGLNNREIGELLGVDYTTVSQGRKRLREKSEKDQEIKSIVEKIDLEMSRIKI